MLKAYYKKYRLRFKNPATTSRGTLTEKDAFYLKIEDSEKPGIFGIGECSPLSGLSIDAVDNFEQKLSGVCDFINKTGEVTDELDLNLLPSVEFAIETALLDLQNGGIRKIADTDFVNKKEPVKINGLIWMAEKEKMKEQIIQKLKDGFKCIKLKIGAINFDDECDLLEYIRKEFPPSEIEIRVDANGAFSPSDAREKLKRLSKYHLHSVEQPIKPGQWKEMAGLCSKTDIPIALDEELIGISSNAGRKLLFQIVKPQYIVLKPTLTGGIQESQDWIELAEEFDTGWWITSALESNIGLNAISQWASTFDTDTYQGLGTGQLYENNIPSPLVVKNGSLIYNKDLKWDLSVLGW